jgi:hypothetical protein
VEAAGIAPGSLVPQVDTQQSHYVEPTWVCLHIACTDFGLRELVANWHRLSADARKTIVGIARSLVDLPRAGV